MRDFSTPVRLPSSIRCRLMLPIPWQGVALSRLIGVVCHTSMRACRTSRGARTRSRIRHHHRCCCCRCCCWCHRCCCHHHRSHFTSFRRRCDERPRGWDTHLLYQLSSVISIVNSKSIFSWMPLARCAENSMLSLDNLWLLASWSVL